MREVLEFDLEELDFRAALTGLVGLLFALIIVGVVGPVGMAAGVAVLFVVAADSDEHSGPELAQLVLVVVGAGVTLLVGAAVTNTLAASLVVGATTLGATLLMLLGPRYAGVGAYVLIWAVLTLSIGVTDESAVAMAGAFAVGGAIAMVSLALSARVAPAPGRTDDESGAEAGPATEDDEDSGPPAPRSSIVIFAVVRACAAAGAVAIGYHWFPDHAAWVVLTFVLVLRPPKHQTVVVAIGRTLGTVLGVLVGSGVAELVGDNTSTLIVAFLACGFFMLATSGVNYAVSTGFTTAMLLLSERILHDDVYETGSERLEATFVGVALAFSVIAILSGISRFRQSASDDTEVRTP